jgi:DNA (cytosine-5)-methyltransferase 1
MLTVTSLFSGIGGIDLGLEMTGHFKTELFSELDPFCQKVLKKHWPNVPIIPDVRDIDGKEIRSDVIVGGFPCQPFSVAGKQKGKNDERHLWPEMFRIIKDAKPSIVIGENVPGLINVQMALGACISDLESENYKVQPFVLPACGVGFAHRRYRVFIIALADSCNERLQSRIRGNGNKLHQQNKQQRNDEETSRGNVGITKTREPSYMEKKDVANTESIWTREIRNNFKKKRQSKQQPFGSGSNVANSNKQRTQIQIEGQHSSIQMFGGIGEERKIRTEEFLSWGQVEPNMGRTLSDGVPNRVDRIKSLGNAVVPQLAYAVGQCIIQAIQEDV